MNMHTIDFATFSGVQVKLPLAAAPHSTPANMVRALSPPHLSQPAAVRTTDHHACARWHTPISELSTRSCCRSPDTSQQQVKAAMPL